MDGVADRNMQSVEKVHGSSDGNSYNFNENDFYQTLW